MRSVAIHKLADLATLPDYMSTSACFHHLAGIGLKNKKKILNVYYFNDFTGLLKLFLYFNVSYFLSDNRCY